MLGAHESADLAGRGIDPLQPFKTLTREEILEILNSPAANEQAKVTGNFNAANAFVLQMKGLKEYMNGGKTFNDVLCEILEMRTGDQNQIEFEEIAKKFGMKQSDVRKLYNKALGSVAAFQRHFEGRFRRVSDFDQP